MSTYKAFIINNNLWLKKFRLLHMYYDMTELRNGYRKALLEEEQKVTNEQLRMLGYSEEDIANKRE